MRRLMFSLVLFCTAVVLIAQVAVWPVLSPNLWRSMTVYELSRLLRTNRINAQSSDGKTALHFASEFSEKQEIILFLLNAGADVYAETHDGFLPLHIATAYNGNPIIISTLVDYTLQPPSNRTTGNTVRDGNRLNDATGNTVRDGNRLNDATGNTVRDGNRLNDATGNIVRDGNRLNDATGNTVRDGTRLQQTRPSLNYMQVDPAYASTLLKRTEFSYTPSTTSYSRPYTDVYQYPFPSFDIRSAIRKEQNNAQNELAKAPLIMLAAQNRAPHVLYALLRSGADITVRTPRGRTVLHYAALNNNPTIVRLLIDNGVEINARTYREKTPLHYAAAYNTNPEVLIILLQAGADPTLPDDNNRTPWDYIQVNTNLIDTKAYWALHDILFNYETKIR